MSILNRSTSGWKYLPLLVLILGLLLSATDVRAQETIADPVEQEATEDEEPSPEETPDDELDDFELQKLLIDTLDRVEASYVKPISRRELIEAAIRGVLSELDPYSNYIPPEQMDRFETEMENEFGGVGIRVEMRDGRLIILTPIAQTPAFESGILAGDQILKIDGEPIKGLSIDEAIRRMKGDVGTDLTLELQHAGEDGPYEVTLTREMIEVETVLGYQRRHDGTWRYFIDDDQKKIAYIRLTAFSRRTGTILRRTLADLQNQGMQGMILDLRFNPGGLLTTAIEVCDLFVSEGTIVSVKGRVSEEREWKATRRGTYEGFPMAVLVNRYSASASEITSACLQDHDRGVIIGERTWGKGSVQSVMKMEDGDSALKITTAAYHRPSGKNIHRLPDSTDDDVWGVMPAKKWRMRMNTAQVSSLLNRFRQCEIIPRTQQSEKPIKLSSIGDEHLRMALKHLRSQSGK